MLGITLKDVKEYFGYSTLSEFSQDWKKLSEDERQQIKSGLENGSLTY
jgi:hypothetical protein